ncbi:MAG: hypothetical protein RLZZ15_508, partial [Verrucomicrobiota bacterium]
MPRLLAVLVLLSASATSALAADRPLNVLFITADDMNADSPGWMGNPLKLTPTLDRFAASAHRFVNQHVTAPICQPSRSAFMSGRVPHHNGALGFEPMREGTPSLVTVLRGAGYFAAGINKLPHMMPETSFPWDLKFMGSGKNPDLIGQQTRDAIAAAQRAAKPFFINCNITDPHRPFYGSEQGAARKQKKSAKKSADPDAEGGEDKEGILE